MRYARGLDRRALQRKIDLLERGNDGRTILDLTLSFCLFAGLDRRRDGKLVAMDLFHLHGHTGSFLRDESNSRCTVRVSIKRPGKLSWPSQLVGEVVVTRGKIRTRSKQGLSSSR